MRALLIDRRSSAVVLLLLIGAARPVSAQTENDQSTAPASSLSLLPVFDLGQGIPQPAGPPPTPRHTGIKALFKNLGQDVKELPSKENAIWAGVGGALALAVHPFDDNVTEALTGSTGAKRFFKPGKYMGGLPTLLSTSLAVYITGRAGDHPKVSHVGMDLIQSLIISEGITQGLKYATRRERPDQSSKTSFPSGHAADTFAFATALERHLGWKYAGPAYILASYVAISRVPSNRHWLSDAVFGSAVGIIAGRTVTSEEASHPYPVAVTHVPGGVAVMYTRRTNRH
jgi:membrane-associated phospholipid phosphatase